MALFLLLAVESFAQRPTIEKVEPPNWWAGHTVNPVRLLLRGSNLKGARSKSATIGTSVGNVRVNLRGDYVFVDVNVSRTAKPGDYSFTLSTSSGEVRVPFRLEPSLQSKSNFQGVSNDDVIYLIIPDRFADGDQSNNQDVDRKNPRAWHGGDFQGIIDHLDYLKELGVTAIWLTPWYDNPDEANRCEKPWCPYTNYHGYHAIDYYGVENHFGTLEDLKRLVQTAHAKGIKVIQDQVANHVGIQHPWVKNPPLENWFSPFSQNTFKNSVLLSPNASRSDRDNLLRGWFNELLPDLNQDEPEVARYEIQNALWWIGVTGIDGIRQDTIQYMPRTFIRDWSAAILKQYPNFYMVGEVFERDSAQTAFFQGGKTGWDGIDTKLPSDFDFKLWETSQQVFTGKKPVSALRDVLKYDGLYPDVNKVTVLTGNHDTDRFMSLPDATLNGAMLHTAFTLSVRGIPQLYYGDEIAMAGGHDPDNRRDFPGGFRGDSKNAFDRGGRDTDEQKMFDETKTWIELRKSFRQLRYGHTIDLIYNDNVYVFARVLDGRNFVIAINTSNESKSTTFDARSIELEGKRNICHPHGGQSTFPVSNFGGIDGSITLLLPAWTVIGYECKASK